MGQAESNESAAVKRQAEGGEVPMYKLLDLSGNFIKRILQSFYIMTQSKQLSFLYSLNIQQFQIDGLTHLKFAKANFCPVAFEESTNTCP